MRFRLLTYNIHKGIGGVDRRYRPDRIERVVAHYRPDVVFLQEVDEGAPRSRFHEQAQMLADAWGMGPRVYQRNVRLREGHYGNAILSHWPLCDPRDVDLTLRFKKRRQALVATCLAPRPGGGETAIVLANVHLGLAEFERHVQLRRLLRSGALEPPLLPSSAGAPVVVAGDFNDVYGSLGVAVMHRHGFLRAGPPTLRTFPAVAPLRPLDRVFYRGALHATHALVGHEAGARFASDHLPLVVDFEAPG